MRTRISLRASLSRSPTQQPRPILPAHSSLFASRLSTLVGASARAPYTTPVHHNRTFHSAPKWHYSAAKEKPSEHQTPVQPIEGATDLSHAHFIASASPNSDFNPSQTPLAGQDVTSDAAPTESPLESESDASSPLPTNGAETTTNESGEWQGKLSPTSSHLFKLLLPLPSSVSTPAASPGFASSNSSPSSTPRQTAFLLHPSQPLSHLSRLIVGSLPLAYRNSEITYLSLTGQASDIDSHLRNAEEQDDADTSGRQEGGPFLGERVEEQGRWQEVSWSQSTDLSDFIKQSCLNERFTIVISPQIDQTQSQSQTQTQTQKGLDSEQVKELVLEIVIPSFASRTHYIRRRLLTLTKNLDKMTRQKKGIDYKAHKGAQRLAVVALGGGVAYWAAVIRYTFFTDAGWDLMEPVTWATGFAALLSSAAFLIYHNREVSYSSLLDLSITARQRKLYGEAGLDIERWTEMVAEAKTLRREISRIAADYDIEWRGELENLAESASRAIQDRRESKDHPKGHRPASQAASPAPAPAPASRASGSESASASKSERDREREREGAHSALGTNEDGDKLDVDATIDEASELAEQSESKRSKERSAQRKDDVIDPSDSDRGGGGEGDRGSRARMGEEKESESEARGRKRAKEVIDGGE